MSDSQDCPQCGRFVQDRPNQGLHCPCGWSKPRGGLGATVDELWPTLPEFPYGDPDEYQQETRSRLFRYHEGPPSKLWRGAYGLAEGDRIIYKRRVWDLIMFTRWPYARGHTLVLDDCGDHRRVRVPWATRPTVRDEHCMWVLTSEHYPACGHCGQPWPCQEVDEAFEAHNAAERFAREWAEGQEKPVVCPEGCGRRFRTERGAHQHVARSRRHQRAL